MEGQAHTGELPALNTAVEPPPGLERAYFGICSGDVRLTRMFDHSIPGILRVPLEQVQRSNTTILWVDADKLATADNVHNVWTAAAGNGRGVIVPLPTQHDEDRFCALSTQEKVFVTSHCSCRYFDHYKYPMRFSIASNGNFIRAKRCKESKHQRNDKHSMHVRRTVLRRVAEVWVSLLMSSVPEGPVGICNEGVTVAAVGQAHTGEPPAAVLCPDHTRISTVSLHTGVTPENDNKCQRKRSRSRTNKRNRVSAFPTDAKERERDRKNADKEAGIERKKPVKRAKFVEDHDDDCGQDLSSIVKDINTYLVEPAEEMADPEVTPMFDGIEQVMLWGSRLWKPNNSFIYWAQNLSDIQEQVKLQPGMVVTELSCDLSLIHI